MFRIGIDLARYPVRQDTGYPVNLKPGYRISSEAVYRYRISGRIFDSTFECHKNMKNNKEISGHFQYAVPVRVRIRPDIR
jgi:hypothetical protein